ncbi:DUF664 domain-containing protein [Nocardia sp. NPDC049220]|uniref:mycothiol transferase n=1 Tax=Nocardia sp. NPDC049220 TaxID=3155273 RepID=UPI0033F9C39A
MVGQPAAIVGSARTGEPTSCSRPGNRALGASTGDFDGLVRCAAGRRTHTARGIHRRTSQRHRGALDGLTEKQARRRLVLSATTLLGLLEHVTWMRRVWFEECVGGTSRRELGLARSPDESFRFAVDDTVASVTAAHREACATAGTVIADQPLDTVVTGHWAGPRTLRWYTRKFCGNWPRVAGTPPSCANRYLPTESN